MGFYLYMNDIFCTISQELQLNAASHLILNPWTWPEKQQSWGESKNPKTLQKKNDEEDDLILTW